MKEKIVYTSLNEYLENLERKNTDRLTEQQVQKKVIQKHINVQNKTKLPIDDYSNILSKLK